MILVKGGGAEKGKKIILLSEIHILNDIFLEVHGRPDLILF